ncbi:hypothetical protein GCM10011380_11790 [Sphingomonas metalli]|uniref:Flagellar hook-associated protein 1 n=1 Tax=Sphingomonas metalli TaxID=1779358 RepID=A0A916WRJ4_9SPHN|nr:flagellar hook-associated protein FlgK [Sphingomonas metalli]GGB23711.1 hypothetical protein GCM10011380_11790 [Sphingomonas metalli]
MSDLLAIGASGVRAYQTALSVVGENIANVGTTGYTRRTTRMTEVSAGVGAVDARSAGNGVLLAGIGRGGDNFATQQVRSAGADLARTETGATWLDRIEKAMTGNQLTARVTSFFNSATALAAEPTSTALRTGMISAADSAAIAFKSTGQALAQMGTDLDRSGKQTVDTLNALSSSLAKVNDGLGRTLPNTAAAAQLADQRDQILEQMSAIVDVGVAMDSYGRATVTAGGNGGPTLVRGDVASYASYTRTGANTQFTVVVPGEPASLTISPNGGAMAGIAEAAERVSDATDAVNDLAADFVGKVNAAQALGKDMAGVTGTDLLTASTTDPTDMTVAFRDPTLIAAAKSTSIRDGSNLAEFAAIRTTGDFEAKLTAIINENATAYRQKTTIAEAQTAIRDGAATALSSAAGVNIDSEAVDLMRFQQAYQASSRVIQAARDTFQSILEIR